MPTNILGGVPGSQVNPTTTKTVNQNLPGPVLPNKNPFVPTSLGGLLGSAVKPAQPGSFAGSYNPAAGILPGPIGLVPKSPQQNVSQQNKTLPSSQVAGVNGGVGTTTPQDQAQAQMNQTYSANNPTPAGGAGAGATGIAGGTQSGSTPSYGGIVGQLIQKAQGPSDAYTQAYNAAQDYNRQLQQSMTNEAQSLAQNAVPASGYGRSIEYQQGAGSVLQNLYAQQQQALGAGFQGASNLLGAANTQQGLQQQGLGMAAGFAAPQQYGPTTAPFNPITGQYGAPGVSAFGSAGLTGLGIMQGQQAAGQTYAQNQAILGKVQSQLPGLQQAISESDFNPSSVTGINELIDWGRGVLSDSSIPKIQGSLNDIVGGLSQVLGVPSAGGSDFRLQFAGSIVNALQSGQSINDAISFAVQQAVAGNQGYLQGAQGASGGGSSGGTIQSGGHTFVKNAQGQWVAQ